MEEVTGGLENGLERDPDRNRRLADPAAMPAGSADTDVLRLDPLVNPALSGGVLVLGGGYTGRRFARSLKTLGVTVRLTNRRALAAADSDGLDWLRFDPEAGVIPGLQDLAGTTAVLVTIPPDRDGDDPVLTHLSETLQRLKPNWVGYLSTTGVYGDSDGAWVDEDSPVTPGLARSQARLNCELAWRRLGLPLQVFRLPAIYGPGRSPLDTLLKGEARLIHKPRQVFSRIHVDDIVGALLHCLALPPGQRPDTLNLADACPCPSSEMLAYAAHLLGMGLPEVQSYAGCEAKLSPMARSFWSENRRACSRRLREGLGYRLRYPSFREGLKAIMNEQNAGSSKTEADPAAADGCRATSDPSGSRSSRVTARCPDPEGSPPAAPSAASA
jgi:nucleoside-diphosphate-sugar epimerase